MAEYTFGVRLRLARQHRGWSLRKLAAMTGLSRTTIRMLECGRCRPLLDTAQVLAVALGVKMEELTG